MRLRFDGRLYDLKAVRASVAAYEGVAKFSVKQQEQEGKGKEGWIVVAAKPASGALDEAFAGEFSNHVLAQMQP